MQSFILSFNAISPIFLLMLLGYGLKNFKVASKEFFDKLNSLVFNIFLPILLFYNIYETKTTSAINPRLIAFSLVMISALFAMGYIAVFVISPLNSRRGVMLQGFFRSNYAILGLPLVAYICNVNSSSMASLMVAIVVPYFNVLSVIALERFNGEKGSVNYPVMLKRIVTNPLLIGCFLGFICFIFKLKLPVFIESTVENLSAPASPLAIIVLGAGFEFASVKSFIKEIISIVAVRLIIAPLIAIPIAVIMGFSGEALATVLIIFASPVAVSSYAMAKQMGGDEALAAQGVVLTSALSLITLFIWIFALSSLGLF